VFEKTGQIAPPCILLRQQPMHLVRQRYCMMDWRRAGNSPRTIIAIQNRAMCTAYRADPFGAGRLDHPGADGRPRVPVPSRSAGGRQHATDYDDARNAQRATVRRRRLTCRYNGRAPAAAEARWPASAAARIHMRCHDKNRSPFGCHVVNAGPSASLTTPASPPGEVSHSQRSMGPTD